MSILINNNPQQPTALQIWEAFRDQMSEDYVQRANNNQVDAYSRALSVIKQIQIYESLIKITK